MEAKRKLKVKTIDNVVYTLEIKPDVKTYMCNNARF